MSPRSFVLLQILAARGARSILRRIVGALIDARRSAALVGLLLVALSCGSSEEERETSPRIGVVRQALTDTDSDGLDDDWEVTHFGSLSQSGGGDFDSDGMTNLEEYTHGFNPTVADALADADGDRYPNIFEIRNGADPNSASSTPAPTFVVNGAGGGTHTTVSAALNAANVSNGSHQIVGISAGTYRGPANLRDVWVTSAKPNLLFIGLEGADKTIIDGELANWGWVIQGNSAVVTGLTFQKTGLALYVDSPGKEVRFVDLHVRDNATTSWATGVHVYQAGSVHIVGSTFTNNAGVSGAEQIWIGAGAATLVNTVVWSQTSSGTLLAKAAGATLTTSYSLVKGQTLSGTGNLAGTVNPKLRSDGHLLWDSPLRAAGGSVAQSRVDMDGEARPTSTPDIGVDQFVDSDADDVADKWELEKTGNLTTLTGRAQDADSDGLTNEQEYAAFTHPTTADTDGDGASDGSEVSVHATNPLVTDTDGDDMPDGWEIDHGLSPLVANGFDDADGDRYPNVFEYAGSSDPSNASSTPASTFVVNGAGGGTHTTIGAAVAAANVSSSAYAIIGMAAGTYKGVANLRDVTVTSAKPKLLFIGLEGAAKTIIDGELIANNYGWLLQNAAVVSSLTFQKTTVAAYVDAPGKEVRFVDLVVRDNVGPSWAAGVHVYSAAKVHVVGSTFMNNGGIAGAEQIWIGAAAGACSGTLTNTVVWSDTSSGTLLAKAGTATLTASYSLVKGQTLSGTGNLAGTVNPRLRSDGHLLWDSPLRGAGGSVAQSRVDMDGEARPGTAPDIGGDQFLDSDADGLADKWELDKVGNLTTLTARTQDADSDGLTNEQEYAALTHPTTADTDGDGVSDGNEVSVHGTNPLVTDTDGDDMPDGWEVTHGLSPLVANGFDDADGDRYPNVFEYAGSSDPSNASSTPASTYVVNGAGGGTHTTIGAAVAAANVSSSAYAIVGIAAGTYKGVANLRDVTVTAAKPKLLFIGLEGAAKTIIDGELIANNYGWLFYNAAVVSSLTFQKTTVAAYIDAPGKELRFVDLVVRDNIGPSWAAGVHVYAGGSVQIVGSTFVDNGGAAGAEQIWIGSGTGTVTNTVVWSKTSTGTHLAKSGSATLTTNYSLVRGQTLSGTGNLAGTVNPKLRSDLRLRSDSPLRAAGGAVAQSRIDIDGELRPSSAPDIGVDQFLDADADGLPDAWEVANTGNTTTISGSGDADADQLTNLEEHDLETGRLDPDTDNDGLKDGVEVTLGTNPFVADADDLTSDLNSDGVIDGIGAQLGHQPNQTDSDGDGVSNANELLMCTDPLRADTDGDGVTDDVDKFPFDPQASALPSNPSDVTPPVITLTSPWYAVEQ